MTYAGLKKLPRSEFETGLWGGSEPGKHPAQLLNVDSLYVLAGIGPPQWRRQISGQQDWTQDAAEVIPVMPTNQPHADWIRGRAYSMQSIHCHILLKQLGQH